MPLFPWAICQFPVPLGTPLDMLREAREDDAKPDPEADVIINRDKAGEFVSEEFSTALEAAGVRTRFKKPGREQRNALAMVDVALIQIRAQRGGRGGAEAPGPPHGGVGGRRGVLIVYFEKSFRSSRSCFGIFNVCPLTL